jgi:hypothetical protein
MPHFPKPAEGSWTQHYPDLGTGPISFEEQWGLDSFLFFPNFMIVVWEPGWYLTYHYWPTAYNQHIFEGTLYFAPAKTARDRMRQELTSLTFKEFALQDCNTLEATQTMLESRRVSLFPINDQEIMIRHLHNVISQQVAAYQHSAHGLAVVAR